MSKIFILADTHFGHKKMLEYCGRPVDFEDRLLSGLFNLPHDCTLIHLGDICIGEDQKWHAILAQLPYRRILVRGNHDNKSNSWYMDNHWDFVCNSFVWNLHGKHITFSHRPVEIPDNEYSINIHGHFHNHLPRLLEKKFVVEGEESRNKDALAILTDRHKLISSEFNNYLPVLLDKVANE